MNVLRKKIDREPGLPDHIKNNVKMWQSLHVAVCEMFSTLTQVAWEPRGIELDFGDLKSVQNDIAEVGLKFGYGDMNDVCTFVSHFDRRFAAHVTTRSLDMSEGGTIESYRPELLDILLFKPIAEVMEEELAKLFSVLRRSATGGLRQIDKGFKVTDFEFARGLGLWNKIIFKIRLAKLPGNEEPDEGIETEEGGMGEGVNDDATLASEIAFTLLVPQNLLQQLVSKLSASKAPTGDGAENPWTQHMYQSLETAKVPVRAVIESREMTVADCTRLQIGDIIELPGVSLQSVGLETEMNDGPMEIAKAALGIFKLNRAVKLTTDLDQDFFNKPIVDLKTA